MSVFEKGKKWVLLVDSKWNKFGIDDDIKAGFGNRPAPETQEQIYSGRNEDFSGAKIGTSEADFVLVKSSFGP